MAAADRRSALVVGDQELVGVMGGRAASDHWPLDGVVPEGAVLDAHGYLRVFDRLKDMINRAGYKVYSVEVENRLCQHPGVLEAAVVARPDPVLGEKAHAFVTARDHRVRGEDLRAFCARALADYKVPDVITVGAEPLPRNANGKLIKSVLRERAAKTAAG